MFDNELSQIRHQLRGQVQALSMCTRVLGRGTTPAEDAEFLGDIAAAAGEIASLLDRLDELESEGRMTQDTSSSSGAFPGAP